MSGNLLEGILSIFGSKLVSVLVGLVMTPILVRILGSGLYGDYAFLMSVFGIGLIFVNAGTFDGIRKYVSNNKSGDWNAEILRFYLVVSMGMSLVLGIGFVLAVSTGFVSHRFDVEFETYFLLVAGLLVVRQFFSIARGTLMGFRVERYSELLDVLRRVLYAVGALSLAAVGLDVTGVLIGDLIATLSITLVGFYLVSQRVDVRRLRMVTREHVSASELLGFNTLNVVLILLTASLYHTDVILLHTYEGGQQTGYYKAALNVAEFLWFVPIVLQMSLLQSTSELWERDAVQRITALSSQITRYNYLFTQLLAIGIAVLADPFVRLYYGPEFLPAVPVVRILLVGALAFAISRPIFSIGQSKGALRPLIAATGFAAGVNLVLNLVLIPRYGMDGAALATAVGYGLMVVAHGIAARRIGFDPLGDLRLGRGMVVAAGTGVVLLAVSASLADPLVELAVVPPIGLLVYLALAVATGAIEVDELTELRGTLAGALG